MSDWDVVVLVMLSALTFGVGIVLGAAVGGLGGALVSPPMIVSPPGIDGGGRPPRLGDVAVPMTMTDAQLDAACGRIWGPGVQTPEEVARAVYAAAVEARPR